MPKALLGRGAFNMNPLETLAIIPGAFGACGLLMVLKVIFVGPPMPFLALLAVTFISGCLLGCAWALVELKRWTKR